MKAANIRTLILLAVGLAFWTAPPAAAAPLPDGGVTREEVVIWLQQHGYTGEIRHFETFIYVAVQFHSGPPSNDYSGIYFYDCVNERCAAIQYFAAFGGDDTITVDKANDWNAHKRTIRAYRRPSSSITGEYDVDVSPGGSWEALDRSLTRWEQVLGIFKTFFGR